MAETSMPSYTAEEKHARITQILHSEIADCNDPHWREVPDFSNRGPNVEKALASVGLPAGNSWCMAYQYLKFQQAGMVVFNGKVILARTGLVQAQVNHFQNNGLLIHAQDVQEAAKAGESIIEPGYLVFVYHPELGRYAHVEAIESVGTHGDFDSIGGNTTSLPWSREGDRVQAHARNLYDRRGGKWRYAFGQTF